MQENLKTKFRLRTPVTYYGGKQQLCSRIVALIPKHNLYCEPFVGGGAIFFAKEPSRVEVINDTNRELINFYKVVQHDYISLEKHVKITLHSRSQHEDAHVIFNNPHLFNDVERAWAVWALANQSVNSIIDNSWGYERKTENMSKKVNNKRESFTEQLAIRLQNVQVECADANYVIHTRDTEESFFYCDPPYINTCQGHYDGYSEADFRVLLDNLSNIKGKFLLSSFPSTILDDYIAKFSWSTKEIEMTCSASKLRKKKVEVLTANFPL